MTENCKLRKAIFNLFHRVSPPWLTWPHHTRVSPEQGVSGGETLGARLGYIIRILQHFATKLWNITNFVMLFQAVMKFLSRLVEFKILVNWGLVHSNCVFLHSSTAVLAIFGGKRQLPPIMPPKIKLSAAIFCVTDDASLPSQFD